jgi:hypothetical protein
MSAINIGDWVWYKGSQGAANAEGATLSQRGQVVGFTGTATLVRWWDPVDGLHPAVPVPVTNLAHVRDLVPQREPGRAPKPPTINAPHAL